MEQNQDYRLAYAVCEVIGVVLFLRDEIEIIQ
jgi:hypothetical protein